MNVAPALMVVLRNLVAADKRIDASEVEAAFTVYRQLTGYTDDLAAFTQWFRNLRANRQQTARALAELSAASPDMRRWIINLAESLVLADGKQTPKESERLAEIRAALS
ncbi:Tellurite resistance protein TerB [Enhygromyxa salina]|uniref:Tellurite resistance protein TerB n=1 Tax=Enhygromyxa salina TaxID=215803 RepID=A0A2S9YCZ4_9BACT|nr:TerB family tellurite resistance protein [Enhygromyxa salina]PRQ02963.1 Tellurite resistance protein TerB [Enhygromyxa salina]